MDNERLYNDNLNNNQQEENISDNKAYDEPPKDVNFIMTQPEMKKPKKSKRKNILAFIAIALIAAIIGGVSGSYVTANMMNAAIKENTGESPPINTQQVNINLNDDIYFAAAVAEKAQKTVVGITSEIEQEVNYFWGPQTRVSQSMGSGFIVDSNGYIVTNSHVIGDGQYNRIMVSLIDGSVEEAEVLWYEPTLDLAILKINKTGLPVAELGDSDSLMVGEPAVAIGNPMTLDLERTTTKGIISGLDRSIQFEDGTIIEPLIQTDASINSGNSGGPLHNAKGQVIGINTAKMTSAEGLGFSIPINIIKPILSQIVSEGVFVPVYVGISGMDVETFKMIYNVNLIADQGVIVIETAPNSPAREAGIQPNDVIIKLDGRETNYMVDIQKRLYEYKDGDKATFTILRNGEEMDLELTMRNRPKDFS